MRAQLFIDRGGERNESSESFGWLNPDSPWFKLVFPHLILLRRKQSDSELQSRALRDLRSRVAIVLDGLDVHDADRIDEATHQLVLRIGDKRLIEKFDVARGSLDNYLYGITRRVALESLRVGKPTRDDLDTMAIDRATPSPVVAEIRDLFEMALKWVEELPPAERQAVIQRYLVACSSTEDAGAKKRRYVNHHRGLKHLRARAAAWLRFR